MSTSSDPSGPGLGSARASRWIVTGFLVLAAILVGGAGTWLYMQGGIGQKDDGTSRPQDEASTLALRFTKADNFKNPGQVFGLATPATPDRYELYITFEIKNNGTKPYQFSPDRDIKIKNANTNATLTSCVLNPQAVGYGDNQLREQVIQPGEIVVGYRMYCAGSDLDEDQRIFTVYFTDDSTKATRSVTVTAIVRPLP
jgi:hypothetical protein